MLCLFNVDFLQQIINIAKKYTKLIFQHTAFPVGIILE